MLDVRRLAVLAGVARTGSMTAMAAEMGVTQPAVAQQLRVLENECGVALIERVGRGVRLTGAGQRLLARALPVIAAVQDIEHDMCSLASGVTGPVSVSAWSGLVADLVAPALGIIRRVQPGVTLQLNELHADDDPLDGLLAGDCDVVILPHLASLDDERAVTLRPLMAVPVLVAPAMHLDVLGTDALGAPDRTDHRPGYVPIDRLEGLDLVLSSHLADLPWYQEVHGSASSPPTVLDDTLQILTMAAHGDITAVVPGLLTAADLMAWPLHRMDPPDMVEYVAVVRSHFAPTPAVATVLDALAEVGQMYMAQGLPHDAAALPVFSFSAVARPSLPTVHPVAPAQDESPEPTPGSNAGPSAGVPSPPPTPTLASARHATGSRPSTSSRST